LTRFTINGNQYQVFHREQLDLEEALARQNQPELMPYDHLTILLKPNWSEKLHVDVHGEVKFPGTYIVQQGETLCSLIRRAGGLRPGAYPYGATFTRESVRSRQQESLDRLKGQLDDLLVQLHLSPSALNDEKMPAKENNHEVIKVIKQLKDKKASGRIVIDLKQAIECGSLADITLEDNDKLYVPVKSDEVNVMGQVYFPTSHQAQSGIGSRDYIDLSGGSTVLGKLKHTYVVHANGEVESMRPSGIFGRARNIDVNGGATIYVPLNVDRINGIEKAESWTKTVFHLAFAAAVL
ncbi:MAG: SLBB domain-containing protein, partial [Gammaproteobacteria bacterium]